MRGFACRVALLPGRDLQWEWERNSGQGHVFGGKGGWWQPSRAQAIVGGLAGGRSSGAATKGARATGACTGKAMWCSSLVAGLTALKVFSEADWTHSPFSRMG